MRGAADDYENARLLGRALLVPCTLLRVVVGSFAVGVLDQLPACIRVVVVDAGGDRCRVLAEVLLVDLALLIDNEGHDPGIAIFGRHGDQGEAGDNIGALVRGVAREDVERGQVLCKPGSVTPHTDFNAEVYVLSKEEGGRHTPFFANYRPQFYFRTTDVTGTVELPAGTEMVMPGDNVALGVKLIAPIAMDVGQRFTIREGGRTVGSGIVSGISK